MISLKLVMPPYMPLTPSNPMPLWSRSRAAALLAALTIGSACFLGPGDCTTELRYGLVVLVRDAATGAPAGHGATATAQDGAYVETLHFNGGPGSADSLSFVGAGERPGRYEVRVNKTGYQPWSRRGIQVKSDACHVQPVMLEARLER